MRLKPLLWNVVTLGSLGIGLIAGCGGGDEPAPDQTSSSEQAQNKTDTQESEAPPKTEPKKANPLPTASIGSEERSVPSDDEIEELKEGSPEWVIQQIRQLRLNPLVTMGTDDEGTLPDLEVLKAARRERNEKIIEMATKAIALTHQDPDKADIFAAAVHELMEARLQLALQVDGNNAEEDGELIDALYADADLLKQRDPESETAAIAAFALARFAHTNARRFGQEEPRWLLEFASQARLFAKDFPQDTRRSTTLLYSAGWSCELHGLVEEAEKCYLMLQEKFPETPQGQQVSAILRRLHLPGQSVQFAGPTIDGGFLTIDDYKGHAVLVVFWATDNDLFIEDLPELLELAETYREAGFQIVGVNLDEEEPEIDEFLEENPFPVPHIFFSDREKRRWENPIVKYYGVRDIPMYWLIDQEGIAVSTTVTLDNLEAELQKLLGIVEASEAEETSGNEGDEPETN